MVDFDMVERTHYEGRYKYGKQKKKMSVDELSKLMLKVKKERKKNHFLGIDVLRDSSLLAMYYWSGLRLVEVVGDRPRTYKVSRFTKEEREQLKREGKDWKKEPNPFIIRTSPERLGIRKEDIEFDEERNVLLVTAEVLKHGERKAPLELGLDLPYVDLIKQQWQRTSPHEKVWNLKREYAWLIIKELDQKIYPHYFRFNRVMEFVRIPSTSSADLLSWFGWKRVQTAYNYLDIGGRTIKKMSAAMVEQYTGKKVGFSREERRENKEELIEQPVLKLKPSPKPKEKGTLDLLKEVSESE